MFAGQRVGVTQVGERIWLVTFMHYDLGYFDSLAMIPTLGGYEAYTHRVRYRLLPGVW